MDRSTRILIDKIGIVLSLVLGALALLGEILGWWNAVGVVLSVFSLILGVLSVVDINGSRILDELGHITEGQRTMQHDHRALASHHDAMIDHQAAIDAKLDSIERLLDERLPGG